MTLCHCFLTPRRQNYDYTTITGVRTTIILSTITLHIFSWAKIHFCPFFSECQTSQLHYYTMILHYDYTTTLQYHTTITLPHFTITLRWHCMYLAHGNRTPHAECHYFWHHITQRSVTCTASYVIQHHLIFISSKSLRIACISVNLKITISPELRIENNFIR